MIEIKIATSVKTAQEHFRLLEHAVLNGNVPGVGQEHMQVMLGDILYQLNQMRPIGPDGKHGDRHTNSCGCDISKIIIDSQRRRREEDKLMDDLLLGDCTGFDGS